MRIFYLYYIIYKTTNLINGKFYIGKHKTNNVDDGYYGSGKAIRFAVKKYGKENFITEVLYIFDTEQKMNIAERILVVIDREISYNICPGGNGGFEYINRNGLGDRTGAILSQAAKDALDRTNVPHTEETKIKISNSLKGNKKLGKAMSKALTGKKKTEEHKQKIRETLLKRNAEKSKK